jgi:hypothetical protein
VRAGALLLLRAGVATALRGPDWPVMSARYDAPAGPGARGGGQAARPRGAALDAATIWESLNGGEDPTEADLPEDGPAAAQREHGITT